MTNQKAPLEAHTVYGWEDVTNAKRQIVFRVDMNTRLLFILILALPALAVAYSPNGINSLLSSYNVSSSVISSLNATSVSYSGSTYVYMASNGKIQFLINASSTPYSFVLNATQISNILHGQLISQALSSINFKSLASTMQNYRNSSSSTLNSCIFLTGLSADTCTTSNDCESCRFVPSCNKVLTKTGGPFGTLGTSIMSFQTQETTLSGSFNAFIASALSINPDNVNANIKAIQSSFSNISSFTKQLSQNPIFPPPQNANYNLCQGLGTSTSNTATSGPWYCNALGYCDSLTYNNTALSQMQTVINQLSNLPVTNSQIAALAQNVTNNEDNYILPILNTQKSKQLAVALNTSLSAYVQLINSSNALLIHISNSSLSAAITSLAQNYTIFKANYLGENITVASGRLASQISSVNAMYQRANSTYNNLVMLAKNNTATLLTLQLNTMNPSPQISALSFDELALNSQLGGRISNPSQLDSNLTALNKQLYKISPSPDLLTEFSRGIDSPVAMAVLGSSKTPYSQVVGTAPLTALIVPFIIGIIIMGMLYYLYSDLMKRHKIRTDNSTRKNWKVLFAMAFIAFIIYLWASYSLALNASSFAPASAFSNALKGSNTLVIAVNGSSSPSIANCSAQLSSAASAIRKHTQNINMVNGTCLVNGFPVSNCLNPYASRNMPVVLLTQSNSSRISVYSYYGTVLYMQGNSTFMNSCPAKLLIR